MNIETASRNGVFIIYPKEKNLDSSISMKFREKIKGYIADGHKHIIVNLKYVDIIDSSGLGALVLGHKEMRKNGEMYIVSAKDNINNMLKLVRLDQVLTIFKNEEDAINSLK